VVEDGAATLGTVVEAVARSIKMEAAVQGTGSEVEERSLQAAANSTDCSGKVEVGQQPALQVRSLGRQEEVALAYQ